MRFSYVFSNPHARPLLNQTFWAYLPLLKSAVQANVATLVSAQHSIETDDLQHQILRLHFDQVAPFGKRVVSVSAEVALSGAPALSTLTEPERWLRSDRFVDVTDADIRALANQLRQPDALQTGHAIYQWVSHNIAYAGYLADDLGATEALRQRRGDCTEYASLAVALARCCGIPARMVSGYALDRDATPRPGDYHDWAELHLDGAWQLVDCQKKRWLSPVQDYVAFRIHQDRAANAIGSAHRFRMDSELQVGW